MARTKQSPVHFATVAGLTLALGIASAEPPRDYGTIAASVRQTVREHFFDRTNALAWSRAHEKYADAIAGDEEFVARTRAALADLKTSHVGYYTPDDVEYLALVAIFEKTFPEALRRTIPGVGAVESFGADFTHEGFVRVVFAGGPAAAAGLRRGDRILRADGAPFHPLRSCRGRANRTVTLAVEREAGSEPMAIAIVPRQTMVRDEWLRHQAPRPDRRQSSGSSRRSTSSRHNGAMADQSHGGRVIRLREINVAYIPLFAAAGDEVTELLRDRLAEAPFAACEALVLDLRDGWGGANPDLMNVFNRQPPIITTMSRDGKAMTFDRQWRKPLVVLINGGSRSGKEAIAFAIKKHRRGTLVGSRSAGAVVAGRCFLLADRSLLYLAVADVRVDGVRLEGVGVEPDVVVADKLEFANGRDPQLDKALDLAVEAAINHHF